MPGSRGRKCKSLSRVQLFETPGATGHHALLPMKFSRQEYWSGLPFPSPGDLSDPGTEQGGAEPKRPGPARAPAWWGRQSASGKQTNSVTTVCQKRLCGTCLTPSSHSEGLGSIPGQGTKIPQTALCSRKKKKAGGFEGHRE